MGSRTGARRAAAALGCAGLLCAVLGAVMVVMVPSLIKQQVLKVGEGRRPGVRARGPGLEGSGLEEGRARSRWAGDTEPGSAPWAGSLSTGETRAFWDGQLPTSPGPSPTQAGVGRKGGHLEALLEAQARVGQA